MGSVGRRVLGRLGVNVDAPTSQYVSAYEVFLPEAATGGYYRLLRDAYLESGAPESWDLDHELAWLSEHLRVRPSDGRLRWWDQAWDDAAARTGAGEAIKELSPAATALLVRRLYEGPEYPSLSEDVLVEALKVDAAA